ncbi:MAG: hypothetical protein P1Q69_18175 [Candidatus Thorarchaeota archaeon]|nr:hypothetical protein [Candidatus Thorarchaeota archaeon]
MKYDSSGVFTTLDASKTDGDCEILGTTGYPWTPGTYQAFAYVEVEVSTALSGRKLKVGFSGCLSYKIWAGIWGDADIFVRVSLMSSRETELDTHQVWTKHVDGSWAGESESGSIAPWVYSTTYKMDEEFTLQPNQTYYAAVLLLVYLDSNAYCRSSSGNDATYLDVSRISWSFYT